ncbi:MAG: F0F1 ATP synthase subunit epsilon [Candidatus Pacebacteria bacterium]|nr:F0F1 ATP synthase subunit epsilon [Candidatus Paceibacterota bacterium]
MAHVFHLTIASPSEVFFDGDATEVSLPGNEGAFQVLAQHEPLITTLRKGMISYKTESSGDTVAIEGGVVEVAENHCTVLL